MQRFEESRQLKAEFTQSLHKQTDLTPAVVQKTDDQKQRKPSVS